MNIEAVIEFLGYVNLLQRFPRSVLPIIAQFVDVKHFDSGDYIIRQGEAGKGLYFVCEGEAEMSGSVHADYDDHDFQLKQYDYFGYGTAASSQQKDVIALTKMTCLLLPYEHCHLMEQKSIWSADAPHKTCSFVEHILELQPLEVNIFKGITLREAPKSSKVFGGQFLGQALAAASKTVHFLKIAHSLHSHFILAGDFDIPIIYQVHRLHDGNGFATRRVDALQREKVVFSLVASFQEKEGEGFDHQESTPPPVSNPEVLPSIEELLQRHQRTNPKKGTTSELQWPTEIRLCESNMSTIQTQGPPRLRYWFRSKGKLSEDQALHRCVVAYASDLMFLIVILSPHRRKGLELTCTSLGHSMWFHRPFRADEWLLYVIDSPSTNNARGFVRGQMFNRKGELVVSVKQVGVIREIRRPASTVAAAAKL